MIIFTTGCIELTIISSYAFSSYAFSARCITCMDQMTASKQLRLADWPWPVFVADVRKRITFPLVILSLAMLYFLMGITFLIINDPRLVAWKINFVKPVAISFPAGKLCKCSLVYSGFYTQTIEHSISCNCSNGTLYGRTPFAHDCPPSHVTQLPKNEIHLAVENVPCPVQREDPKLAVLKYQDAWWAQGRVWHYPVRLPRCSLDVCFNYSRCDNMQELLIYSYNVPAAPVRYFSRLNQTQWHTDDPSRACLFFVFLDDPGPYRSLTHPRELPYWNGGMNHVLISFADMWMLKAPAEATIGASSVMASDMHETIYRPTFDISVPLPGRTHVPRLQTVKPLDRKYLLTFRGKRYLGHNQEGVLRSFSSFRGMHNGKDVIVATTCRHLRNDLKRMEDPSLGKHCDEDEVRYKKYSFRDLMNSTFGLVPAGMQPNSYRFIEVLSAGTIPVLIADNYVKPFEQIIQWHTCILQFPSTQMHRIVPAVRALRPHDIHQRYKNCVDIYKFLKNDDALLNTSIRALKARFMGVFPSFTAL